MRRSARPLAAALAVLASCQSALAEESTRDKFLENHSCIDCKMDEVDLSGDSYVMVDLTRAYLNNVDFTDSGLLIAIFDDARIERTSFRNASLRGASFANARFRDVDFEGADLAGARFKGAHIDESAFEKARTCNTLLPDGATLMSNNC